MIDLNHIISISGKPGLYKLLTQSRKGLIVESVEDGKKVPAQATQRISALEDISIFMEDDEEISLEEVFHRIYQKEDGGPAIDHRSDKEELAEYFEDILPGYDKEKVYHSDIKKCFQWYNLLHEADMLKLKEKEEGEEDREKSEESQEEEKTAATESGESSNKKDQ